MKLIDRLSNNPMALTRNAIGSASASVPQWLSTGAALTLAKTGTKVASTLVRRNPAFAVAVGVVGAGVLAYRFYRRRELAQAAFADNIDTGNTSSEQGTEGAPIEVSAVRKVSRRKTAASKRASKDA